MQNCIFGRILTDVNDCHSQTEPQRILEGLDSALHAEGSNLDITAVVLIIARTLMPGNATASMAFGQVIFYAVTLPFPLPVPFYSYGKQFHQSPPALCF